MRTSALDQITPENVRTALEDLLYKGNLSEAHHPLHDLLLVECICGAPDFPLSRYGRSIALSDVLTNLITESYYHHRRVQMLEVPDIRATKESVLQTINEDSCTGKRDLIHWGWLYHCYVRGDANLDLIQLTGAGKIDERTLRRHISHGVHRLTKCLLQQENLLRRAQRKKWLTLQLPSSAQLELVGRERLLERMQSTVMSPYAKRIQISGDKGVGKTCFVQTLVRKLIEQDHVDQLIWIDKPQSVAQIEECIQSRCLQGMAQITLREYFARHSTTIVIDGVDALDTSMLNHLLTQLNGAAVLLIGCYPQHLVNADRWVIIPELNQEEAEQFIYSIFYTRLGYIELPPTSGEIAYIYGCAGGNPAKIIREADELWQSESAVKEVHLKRY